MEMNRIGLYILIIVVVLACPVQARIVVTGGQPPLVATEIRQDNIQSFTYTANPNEKIATVEFDIPINTAVNFTLYYGTSSTVSGWAIYRIETTLVNSYSEVDIGGNTYSEIFIDPLISGYSDKKLVKLTGYARNDSATDESGFALYDFGYGYYSGSIAYFPVPDLPLNLIYRIDMTASGPINLRIEAYDTATLANQVSATAQESLWNSIMNPIRSLYDFAVMMMGVGVSLLFWLKYIFVDNLLLTVAFYVAGTAAYAMLTSKNIFQVIQRFFGFQVSLFNFILNGFYYLSQLAMFVKNQIPWFK